MPIESHMQAVLDQYLKFGSPPIEQQSPQNARHLPTLKHAVEEMSAESMRARAMNFLNPVPEPVGAIRHVLIPCGPDSDGELVARIYRPSDRDDLLPVIVYFHGGGWVIANLDTYEPTCRALCNAVGAVVVSVAYRQAPEHKFPAAVDDAYAALQWALVHASSIGGDPALVAVAGESAGANLATVACLRAKAERGRQPVAQLLVYPVTSSTMDTASYREFADGIPLSAGMMSWFWGHYLNNPEDGRHPYASPLVCDDLAGLPPACVITAENDPLRDEGEAYAARLDTAGVSVNAIRVDGMTHVFFGLAGAVPKAKGAVADAAEWLLAEFGKRAPPLPPPDPADEDMIMTPPATI